MKIGDVVNYIPKGILKQDGDQNVMRTTILDFYQYCGPSGIFNQSMAVIDGVEHWVPACDLVLVKEK